MSRVGAATTVSVEKSKDNTFGYESKKWDEIDMTWAGFLDEYRNATTDDRLYVSEDLPEALRADLGTFPFSLAPCAGAGVLEDEDSARYYMELGVWMGSGGQVSLLHNDPEDNFLAMVDGRKALILFSPEESARVYEALPRVKIGRMPEVPCVDSCGFLFFFFFFLPRKLISKNICISHHHHQQQQQQQQQQSTTTINEPTTPARSRLTRWSSTKTKVLSPPIMSPSRAAASAL
jgi:hypothetical protein